MQYTIHILYPCSLTVTVGDLAERGFLVAR